MSDVPALMKRCQIGVPRGPNAYDDLHSILAECYGTLGSLGAENVRLREALISFTKSSYIRHQHPRRFAAAVAALKGANHE